MASEVKLRLTRNEVLSCFTHLMSDADTANASVNRFMQIQYIHSLCIVVDSSGCRCSRRGSI